MKRSLSFTLVILMSTFSQSLLSQSVLINEFQNKNYRTLEDEDGEFEDWVEIINTSDDVINLEEYGLSDSQSQPFRWTFPSVELASGELLLVFLSGKDRNDENSELHTNFSLSDSEELLISSPGLLEVDIIPPVSLLRDMTYGRAPDGQLVYFGEPTPGAPNLSQTFSGICSPPTFSHSSGFYTESFELAISSGQDHQIIYSTDGSNPSVENIGQTQSYDYKNSYALYPDQSNGPFLTETYTTLDYNSPIEIMDRSSEPDRLSQKSSTNDYDPDYFPDAPSFKGTVVKARATAPGLLPSKVVSKVFFISPEGWSRYDLPTVSIVVDDLDLFEYQQGILTAGKAFDVWRQNNPDTYPPPIFKANYGRRGDLWERPAQVDFFNMEGESIAFSSELGLRIHGASSRRFPRKSFRLYARGTYDIDQIQHEFFPSHYVNTFERLILRNGGSDEWLTNIRDAVVHRIAKPIRATTLPSQPHYVFVNGEFYGLNNLREYIDDNYFKVRFGINAEDLDLIKGINDVESGDNERYLQVTGLCENENFVENTTLDQFEEWVDTDSYIDVFAVNLLTTNADMFTKNTIWWRDKGEQSQDHRFRSILIDLDRSLGHKLDDEMAMPEYNTVSHFLGGTEEILTPYLVCFMSAMENESFRNRFINRSADMMNTYFKPARATEIINEMRGLYLPRYDEHIERWSRNITPQTAAEWSSEIDTIIAFAETRPDFHRAHLDEYFEAGGTYELALDVSDEMHGFIHLNTISVNEETEGVEAPAYPWEGIYFKDIEVALSAVPNEGYLFSHWEGALIGEEDTVLTTFSTDSVYVKAIFIEDTTSMNVSSDSSPLIQVYPNPSNDEFYVSFGSRRAAGYSIYDLRGRRIADQKLSATDNFQFSIPKGEGVYFLQVNFSNGERARAKVVRID